MNSSNATTISPATTQSNSNTLQNPYFEIPYLLFVSIFGTLGNLLIVAAVKSDRKLRVTGIAYVVNLAVSDFFITACYLPVLLANILNGYENVLVNATWLCHLNGFGSALCCQVSMLSLTAIGVDRYVKVLHPNTHKKYFRKNWQVGVIIGLLWTQAFLVSLPIAIGWFGSAPLYGFDVMMMACMWNDIDSPTYNVFLVVMAIFIPLLFFFFCYHRLYLYMKEQANEKSLSTFSFHSTSEVHNSSKHHTITNHNNTKLGIGGAVATGSGGGDGDKMTTTMGANTVRAHYSRQSSLERHLTRKRNRREERERHLVNCVIVVLVCFLVSWMPYALMTLIDTSHPLAKRACGWLALSNSAINSVIYGLLNRHFRSAYVNLARRLLCCPCAARASSRIRTLISRTIVSTSAKRRDDDDDVDEGDDIMITSRFTAQPTVTFDPDL